MNRLARLCSLALLLTLAACEQKIELTTEITEGWQGHAWGADQDKVLEDLGLNDADARTTPGGATLIGTGKERMLGDAAVTVGLCFIDGKLVGVHLAGMLDSKARDAAAGMDRLFGGPGEDNVWQKGGITGEMMTEGDAYVVFIRKLGVLIEPSDQVRQNRQKLEELRQKLEPDGPADDESSE